MEQKNKRKSKFAVLLVREKEDGTIRQYHLNSLAIELSGLFLFILAVIAVCQILFQSIQIDKTKQELTASLDAIDKLTADRDALTEAGDALETENRELSDKVAVLSETVATKVKAEEERAAETESLSLPQGFPLNGGASTPEELEADTHMLLFHASAGSNVVTVGAGIVESVNPDEQYGTKLVFDHQNGYRSIYYNQGEPLVQTGEELGKGYILFLMGEDNTDLGFQIMQDEEYIDPMEMMEIRG